MHDQPGGGRGEARKEGTIAAAAERKLLAGIEGLAFKLFIDSLLLTASRENPRFQGREDEARALIEEARAGCHGRHLDKATDPRSEWTLMMTSLAVAAHKVLRPWVGEEALFRAMRELLGEKTGGVLGAAQRMLLAAKWDKFAHVSKSLRTLEADSGNYFLFEHRIDPGRRHEAVVKRCLYNEVTREEGAPELMSVFCRLDRSIFDNLRLKRHGMRFSRPTTLADGDDSCNFILERAAAGPAPS